MIHKDLKKAIILWLLENENEWNRVTSCYQAFRAYIYNEEGDYLIGGEDVAEFIRKADDLIYCRRIYRQ